MKKSEINLKIQNNTSLNQSISLFNLANNPNSASQAQTEYVFDLTGYTFLNTTFGIIYDNLITSQVFIIDFIPYSNDIIGLTQSLNNLGIGLWQYQGNILYFNSNTFNIRSITLD